MARTRLVLLTPVCLVALAILGIGVSGPFFATNEPYGRGSLVVEGWLPGASLLQARDIYKQGRYDHMFVTGTLRPVSHHLRANETLTTIVNCVAPGDLTLRIAGLPGVHWTLYCDQEVVMSGVATSEPLDLRAMGPDHGEHTWRFGADTTLYNGSSNEFVLFVGDWSMNGSSLHVLADTLWIAGPKGSSRPAARDHATHATILLTAMGMEPAQMTALPAFEEDQGRTIASAQRFCGIAMVQGVDTCDILTLGVHARRSWSAFRDACGANMAVGIIALQDTLCDDPTSGQLLQCWLQRAKEVLGLFLPPDD